ncbi:serine aminopeptidase S33 family [Actinocorallia herbida]|uniref:Serine aminopeptidase S33 family n=1 Tax=Actinocorallia herbida TaxID=58109 RepID=A0A3N1D4E3_9ACTN|nr:alpha/beta fold hydrolase [Actinocorallia herbida]ROO88404.1 serine aminopeptidase S33 family [Actinocorallia herbida]
MSAAEFAAMQWTRATGVGLDPHEYQQVTGNLADPADWTPAFVRAARGHLARAEAAGSPPSAGAHLRTAARWFHMATLAPLWTAGVGEAAAEADAALAAALALLEPAARRIEGDGFTGWLRGPADAAATVVVVPGLDSAKEEFLDVADALLARGLAVFAMDGPGQGVLAADTTVQADCHRVVGRVLDALGAERAGAVGLSLGGYYAAETAAREPRIAAAATVSGPFRLDWDDLPAFLQGVLARRAGGEAEAAEFARRIDLAELAPRITAPLLVVDGGRDVVPGVTNGAVLAGAAPRGEYLCVPHGDHLLGNARPDWLPQLADWITRALTGAPK